MATNVLVVGSGVIGLRTTLELVRRRVRVRLVSPVRPLHPSTCSVGAGGLWMPFHCDDDRTDRWSFDTLGELTGMMEGSRLDSGERSLVEVLPAVAFQRNGRSEVPGWATDARGRSLEFRRLGVNELYEEAEARSFRLPKRDVVDGAGYSHAWLFEAPVIDAPRMLSHMLDEIKASEYTEHINVDTGKYYTTIEDMTNDARAQGCDGLVNCTGLGSKRLCDDESLIGARGVLLHYDRSTCVWIEEGKDEKKDSVILIEEPPLGSDTMPCYMIPRGDVIAVGGSYIEGDEESSVRPSERERVIQNAKVMGIDVEKSEPIGEWVGFRPYRPTSRLEMDEEASESSGVRVVHSYGYGGSGWTVFVGAAREAASLLVQSS